MFLGVLICLPISYAVVFDYKPGNWIVDILRKFAVLSAKIRLTIFVVGMLSVFCFLPFFPLLQYYSLHTTVLLCLLISFGVTLPVVFVLYRIRKRKKAIGKEIDEYFAERKK